VNDESENLPEVMPIFPLPEIVLFPRAVLPLHVFEPRYQAMTGDALAGDKAIALALLRPGFEPLYYTHHAPIHRILGLGRIVASEELDDGKYNILIRGEARGRLIEELPGRPYRRARVEQLHPSCQQPDAELSKLRRRLRQMVRKSMFADSDVRKHWLKLLRMPLGLGEATDLIVSGLPIDGELKQCFLAEPDEPARAVMLLEQIRTLSAIINQRRRLPGDDEWRLN
jgi:Lon protease-like protein